MGHSRKELVRDATPAAVFPLRTRVWWRIQSENRLLKCFALRNRPKLSSSRYELRQWIRRVGTKLYRGVESQLVQARSESRWSLRTDLQERGPARRYEQLIGDQVDD